MFEAAANEQIMHKNLFVMLVIEQNKVVGMMLCPNKQEKPKRFCELHCSASYNLGSFGRHAKAKECFRAFSQIFPLLEWLCEGKHQFHPSGWQLKRRWVREQVSLKLR